MINEIKSENEYHTEEIHLLKSVIDDLKKEKKDLFEQKNEQIKNLKIDLEEKNSKANEFIRFQEHNDKILMELKNEINKIKQENEDLKNKKNEIE